jgi:uncharacterized membrane protein YdjX (TVP38/TMEM64 family)
MNRSAALVVAWAGVRLWPWLILIVAAAWCTWSWSTEGVVYDLLRSDLTAAEKIARLQQFFDRCGPWAPVLYTAFVVVEVVVAPIPGIMLYAPGGMIFGPIWGGALALLGNTLGAGLACVIAQRLSAARRRNWPSLETSSPLRETIRLRGARWIFWLRLNPLTSSDLLSYAAGLAGIPARHVMLATACGMAPLCFAQSFLSDHLFHRYPVLLYPLLALGGIYLVTAIFLLRRELARLRPQLSQDA